MSISLESKVGAEKGSLLPFPSQGNANILAQHLFAGWTEKLFRLKNKNATQKKPLNSSSL